MTRILTDEMKTSPTPSQIVLWLRFGWHHAKLTILQARERETVAQITCRWDCREWVGTSGTSCEPEDEWDPEFGIQLATLRAQEDLCGQFWMHVMRTMLAERTEALLEALPSADDITTECCDEV